LIIVMDDGMLFASFCYRWGCGSVTFFGPLMLWMICWLAQGWHAQRSRGRSWVSLSGATALTEAGCSLSLTKSVRFGTRQVFKNKIPQCILAGDKGPL